MKAANKHLLTGLTPFDSALTSVQIFNLILPLLNHQFPYAWYMFPLLASILSHTILNTLGKDFRISGFNGFELDRAIWLNILAKKSTIAKELSK